MHRSLFALVTFAALAGCAAETTTEPTEVAAAEGRVAPEQAIGGGTTPICPEGEKISCTLGPPPVCSCVPIKTTPPGGGTVVRIGR